jgi:branched-chain amino acid transport system permease protein
LAAAVIIAVPLVLPLQNYVSGVLIFVGIYVLLAVSLGMLVGFAGQISLGHAAFFGIGAYTSGILTSQYGWPAVPAMLVGAVLAGLVAAVVGRAVLNLKGYYLAMATLGLGAVVNALLIGGDQITGGASGLRDIPPFDLFGIVFEKRLHYYYLVWAIVLAVVALCHAIAASPYGRALFALHEDERIAAALAVDSARYKREIFILASMIAAVAGSLLAHHMQFIAPADFDLFTSIHVLVMVFLGGAATVIGPVVGAIFLKLLPEVTAHLHDYELLINGAILVIVVAFVPQGLSGLFRRKRVDRAHATHER